MVTGAVKKVKGEVLPVPLERPPLELPEEEPLEIPVKREVLPVPQVEIMTFEELNLELEVTDEGLLISPEFALSHDLEIPEGQEWFVVQNLESETGYDVVPLGGLPAYQVPDWESLHTGLATLKMVTPSPAPRNFAWNYDAGRYTLETPEKIEERLRLYAENPALAQLGTAEPRLTEKGYADYQDRVLEGVFPGQTLDEVREFAESAPDEFYNQMLQIGQTKETVDFFMTFFPDATKEDVELFFNPMSYIPEKPLTEVPLGAYKITKQPIESVRDFFVKDPGGFRIAILLEGRTEETEALVREMFLVNERPPSRVGGLLFQQRAVVAPWLEYYGREIPDDILDVYFKEDFASKLIRGEYLPEALGDYAKIYLQGWGDLAAGLQGFADRVGVDALSRTMELEALEGHLISREVDWGEKGSVGWYAKQFTRMVPFIQTAIATSLVPGGIAFNALKAAGATSFIARTGATIVAGASSAVTEGTIEAGLGYNEAKARGFTQEESNAVFDRILMGNIGLLSLTNTAQIGAAMFLPGGNTLRLITKGAIFGFASASQGIEEGGQLLINRYSLGDEALVFDNEFWDNFKIGMAGGLVFQGAATVFSSIITRVDGKMTDAQKLQWQEDVAEARLEGFSLDEAEANAYDLLTETLEGEVIVNESIEEIIAEEKAEAIEELPKVFESFAPVTDAMQPIPPEAEAVVQEHLPKAEVLPVPTEEPPPVLREDLIVHPTLVEQQESFETPGSPTITEVEADTALSSFANYLASPTTETAWNLTQELRTKERGIRAARLKTATQKLIIEQGMDPELAMNEAIKLTMSGELPVVRADYILELTQGMRDALYAKVYHVLKNEPFEMMSTHTALTNALAGNPIPRKLGVEGGSAYTRLLRVFGDKQMKAINKAASEGKSLSDVVEGIFTDVIEGGRPPVSIDPDTLDHARSLRDVPHGQASLFEAATGLPHIQDLRTPAERQFAKAKLDLGIALDKGEITKDEYDIEITEARDRSFPQPPLPPVPPDLQNTFDEIPMWPEKTKHNMTWAMKGIGISLVDVGNFMRANKASFDLSFWRQQAPLILNNKVAFMQANVEAWKALWSQKTAEASWTRISRSPLFQIYDKGESDFLRPPPSALKGQKQWRGTEEFGYTTDKRPLPRFTQKLPHVKVSQRGFETGTNEHNWRIYENHYNAMLKVERKIASGEIKLKPGEAFNIQAEMDAMAAMLADFTGRASLGKLAPAAPAFSALMFAPRLSLGRLLTPRHLISSNPHVRKEAWKNLLTFVGGVGGVIVLGEQLGLWDFEKDPRSANFGQIRIGNTRVDPWGGYRPYVNFLARAVDGTGLSSVTGAEYEVDPLGATMHFMRGKAAPMAALLVDTWTGKTFLGDKLEIKNVKQWIDRVAPFAVQDLYEAYQESPGITLAVALPALLGAGVATYTGDWKEDKLKLGQPKYDDNLIYGVTEPIYDVRDFWADYASDFKGVDPETLTKEQGFPPYIKSMVEAVEVKESLRLMPNQSLASINADPTKGTTFIQYYQMWQTRLGLSEDEQKDFDADERTRNAHLGNMTQRQYSLLVEYHGLLEQERETFLEEHPELAVNQRDDWLKSHPEDNAKLAIWGQEDVLTKEAYDIARGLIKEFDIPDSAVEEYLPPDDVADVYFERNDIVEEWGSGSWEDKLHRGKNPKLNEWLGLAAITDSIPSLELKVQYRTQFELWDSYGDRKSPNYLSSVKLPGEDTSPRDRARARLFTDSPGFEDARLRTQAYDQDVPSNLVDDYVGYYMLPILGYDRELFLQAHPEFYRYWVEELGHNEIDFDRVNRIVEGTTEAGKQARLKGLPPTRPIGMHLLSTEEIINILTGEPARSWWEGIAWKFGGELPNDEDARRILAAYGATPEEIEKLLALLGSRYEGRTVEDLDQLIALVQQLSRVDGLFISAIIEKIGGVIEAPIETPVPTPVEENPYYKSYTPTPTLTAEGARYLERTGEMPPR